MGMFSLLSDLVDIAEDVVDVVVAPVEVVVGVVKPVTDTFAEAAKDIVKDVKSI